MSKRAESREHSEKAATWLQTLGKGADYAIITEALVSELGALYKDSTHIHEIILSCIIRGIEKELDRDCLDKTKAASLEQQTEGVLSASFGDVIEREKEFFQKVYKSKKEKIAGEREMLREKDIAKLILEYETMGFNVFSHVVKKYLSDPNVPEEDKKNMRKFSGIIDKIRIAAQTTTAGSLARIAQLSQALGENIAKNAERILPEPLIKRARTDIPIARVTRYLMDTYSKAMNKGVSTLLTLPNNLKELGDFVMAGAYEGVKTPKSAKTPQKSYPRLKPNALQAKLAKKARQRERAELMEKYGTEHPTMLQQLSYMSGYDEWKEAYAMVKRMYEKHDERVEKGMDEVLAKVTAKAKSQEELEARRGIKQKGSEPEKAALTFYDSIRAAATASTLVTHANLYRAGRSVGRMARSAATWMDSDDKAQNTQIEPKMEEELQEAAKGLKGVKSSRRSKSKSPVRPVLGKLKIKKKIRGR